MYIVQRIIKTEEKKNLRFAFYELSKLTRKKKGNEAKSEATKKNLRYTKNNKS